MNFIIISAAAVGLWGASASEAFADADALDKLRGFASPPRSIIWSYVEEREGKKHTVFNQSAASGDGRFGVWLAGSPSGVDPAYLAYYDGQDMIYSQQAGIFSRTPTPPLTTRMVLTNWSMNPAPLLARIAGDLGAESDSVVATTDGQRVSIAAPKRGLTFRFENRDLVAMVCDRGEGAQTVRSETVFSAFSGVGAERHPTQAKSTVTIGNGEVARTVQVDYTLVSVTTQPLLVEAALNAERFTKKSDRRELSTGNVYSPEGELKYNEEERLQAQLGMRPWYSQRTTWVFGVGFVAVAIAAWRLRQLRSTGRGRS